MIDIIKALEVLRKLELKASELYAYYHSLFKEDKETSGIFFELSIEEKAHADLIDYQLRHIKKNRLLFTNVEFDTEPLNQWLEEISAEVASTKPVSLKVALEFGIKLESDSVENYYRTLMEQSNPEVGELIAKLSSADKEHFDKLQAFAKKKMLSVS